MEELELALIEIRNLPWVDQDRVFLMGISEGGRVVATWAGGEFVGHIIIAASCNAEQNQIPAAPKNQPVLAVVGELDDWAYQSRCQTSTHASGSKSVVIKGAGHGVPDLKMFDQNMFAIGAWYSPCLGKLVKTDSETIKCQR